MNPKAIPVAELVPHAGNMVLVKQLLEVDENNACALVEVSNDNLFLQQNNAISAGVGIEYMAQTIAAWAGYHAKLQNQPVKLGFLLGTRRFTSNVSFVPLQTQLVVSIEKVLQADNGLASFDCQITGEGILMQATLNVFQADEDVINQGASYE